MDLKNSNASEFTGTRTFTKKGSRGKQHLLVVLVCLQFFIMMALVPISSLASKFFKSTEQFKMQSILKFSPPGCASVNSTHYYEGSCPYELTCIGIFQIHPSVYNIQQFKIFHHQEGLMCLSTIYSEGSSPYELDCIGIFQKPFNSLKFRAIQNFSSPGGASVLSSHLQ